MCSKTVCIKAFCDSIYSMKKAGIISRLFSCTKFLNCKAENKYIFAKS